MTPPSPTDAALAEYGVLEEPGGRDLQALTELAALVCGVPTAAINLITSDEQRQVAAAGIDPSVCGREESMCAVVLGDRNIVVVEDARDDERFATNPFVTGVIAEVRFYASAPLTTPGGVTIGRLCVFDDQPRTLSKEQADVLAVLADRIVDVLELRLRSRQLEQTRDELHRSNELLMLFAGQVSHDLRSPLTAVMANAELLATEPVVQEDAAVAALVGATLDAGRRMNGMIETILEYARPGAALNLTTVDLGALVEEIRSDLAPALKAREARIITAALPTVRGDERQLYVVLQNLVSNAVKFAGSTVAPVVTIAAAPDETRWRVTVTDNGPGIPEDRREGIFELYARGDSSIEGSGIGLATARRVVEAHGGEIGVTEADGGGAEVWFTLPA